VENLHEIRKRMENMLAPVLLPLLQTVAGQASELDLPLYLVGGSVRDLLLGRPATDIDLVVEGDAIRLGRALTKKYGGRLTVHTRFGTAQWFMPQTLSPAIIGLRALDLTSSRWETYKQPAALPTVHLGSLADDLRRRDFSCNALALRLDGGHFGELHDEVGGLDDLQNRLLRVLHPLSFIDDPTRLFRLIRYEGRYGFRITAGTLALIPEALPGINLLSAERVRHELDLVLEEENVTAILEHMAVLGIITAVNPALDWNDAIRARFENAQLPTPGLDRHPARLLLGWCLWLMSVPERWLESINRRLNFDARTHDVLSGASTLLAGCQSLSGIEPSRVVAALDAIPLAAVWSVFRALPPGPVRQRLSDYLETWRHVKPKTDGNDLRSKGLPPGPSYQTILGTLRDAWLDGKIKTAEDEKILLEKLLRRNGQPATPKSTRC